MLKASERFCLGVGKPWAQNQSRYWREILRLRVAILGTPQTTENFVIDCLLFSDHTPTPGLVECREFNLVVGSRSSWIKGMSEIIHFAAVMDFCRPQTDNDSPQDGVEWMENGLN